MVAEPGLLLGVLAQIGGSRKARARRLASMASNGDGPAAAVSTATGQGGLNSLPWQQIPKFVPRVTSVDEYCQRLRFIKELWPAEYISYLGPRAALQVEGSAFQKVSRISPEKLKSEDGVKFLVESLGGAWGRTAVEEKFHFFEQAIFQVQQRSDESNDSYISRHDAFFEELLTRQVSLEEVRAYVLLRHSRLAPEDKKKVVVEAHGDLRYAETVKAVRLLGSRFFNELNHRGTPGSSKETERSKVYDIHMTHEDESVEEAHVTVEEDMCDEEILVFFLENNDEDAIYVTEFEDGILEAIQESELASAFVSYQEARQRLRDKAKARGYYPPSKGKAKGKGQAYARKGKGYASSWNGHRGRSLTDRIANSACRLCGQKGHWKRECPRRMENATEATNYTQDEFILADLPEILHNVPEAATFLMDEDEATDKVATRAVGNVLGDFGIQGFSQTCLMVTPKVKPYVPFEVALARRLLMLHRKPEKASHSKWTSPTEAWKGSGKSAEGHFQIRKPAQVQTDESVFVLTSGAEGVLDTGASRTVVGEDRIKELMSGLPVACRKNARKIQSGVTFRFGNSGTLTSKFALLLPAQGSTWIRIEVIPGETPLLISNRLLRDLDAVIHVKKGWIILGNGSSIATRFDERGLTIVDLSSLLQAPTDTAMQAEHHMRADLADNGANCKPWTTGQRLEAAPPIQQNHPRNQETSQSSPSSKAQRPGKAATSPRRRQPCQSQVSKNATPPLHHRFSVPEHHALVRRTDDEESSRATQPVEHRRALVRQRGHPSLAGRVDSRKLPQRGVCQAAGHHQLADMGINDTPEREAQGQDSSRGVQHGSSLRCVDGQEDLVVESVGVEFQELRHGMPEEDRGDDREGQEAADGQETVNVAILPQPDSGGCALGRGDRSPDRMAHLRTREESGTDGQQGRQELVGGTQEDWISGQKLADDGGHHQRGATGSEGDSREGAGLPGRDGECLQGVSEANELQVSVAARPEGFQMTKDVCQKIDDQISMIEEQLQSMQHAQKQWSGRYRLPSLDVIEITNQMHGEVCTAIQRHGGRAITVNYLKDLKGPRGPFDRLWHLIHMYEPMHLWLDVRQAWRCVGRGDGSKELWPEELFLELYRHQIERGAHIHFVNGRDFFEQSSEALREVQHGTLCAIYSLSDFGRTPLGNNFLKQNRQIYTTSRQLQQAIDTRAKPKPNGESTKKADKQSAASRTSLRQERFAMRVAQALRKGTDMPLPLEELLFGEQNRESPDPDLATAQQVLKRRRLHGKQAVSSGAQVDVATNWGLLFKELNSHIPRVGRTCYKEGDPELQQIQRLIPQMLVKYAVVCRGTDRIQLPPIGCRAKDIPLRLTAVVRRDSGEVEVEGCVEEWSRLPRYKQNRKGTPARISLTAYGLSPESMRSFSEGSTTEGRSLGSHAGESQARGHVVERENSPVPAPPFEVATEDAGESVRSSESQLLEGFPPKRIPRHGPGYLRLGEREKNELVRLHNNLGHPNVDMFVKFLQERKVEPALIQGARDFECSTCLETGVSVKASRPATIHQDGDFGDVLGMDVAYWTNGSGQKFLFTHIVDEATLFQQAVATGRTPEEQFEVLADQWFQWAGVCKVLYVDPAGEYNSDFWRLQLQKAGIQTQVSAGEAHWQLGRTEAHGKILKSMLTRMDHAEPIRDEQEFRRALRQAVLAKNSLSRVRGFTPEQAVLGKMTRLPASLTADDGRASHALAASDTPEGVQFRRDLQRREQARVAFIQADNDNAYRRALLRRSRPQGSSFEAGDWVLYWRRQKNGGRGERGRWYGPGQVVCGDHKVVWISHCGQLIRASPEQIRSASLREWHAAMQLPSLASSDLARDTRQIVDIAGSGEVPLRAEV